MFLQGFLYANLATPHLILLNTTLFGQTAYICIQEKLPLFPHSCLYTPLRCTAVITRARPIQARHPASYRPCGGWTKRWN